MPKTHALERWRPVEIDRRKIKAAPYNPRQISRDAKARLSGATKKVGLEKGEKIYLDDENQNAVFRFTGETLKREGVNDDE